MTMVNFPKDTIVVPPFEKVEPAGEMEEEEERVSVATALKMAPPLADLLPPPPAAGVTPAAALPSPKLHLRRSSVALGFPLSSDMPHPYPTPVHHAPPPLTLWPM
jgi:hypothetical protein